MRTPRDFSDFHELILLGHNARLTPEQVYTRFIDGGLDPKTVPAPTVIRVIGCSLVGPACRWRIRQGRMTAWVNGLTSKIHSNLLQKNKKSV